MDGNVIAIVSLSLFSAVSLFFVAKLLLKQNTDKREKRLENIYRDMDSGFVHVNQRIDDLSRQLHDKIEKASADSDSQLDNAWRVIDRLRDEIQPIHGIRKKS